MKRQRVMNAQGAALQTFFQQFADDFAAFDGALIASRYHVPFQAINAEGNVTFFDTPQAIAAYFQTYLDRYRKEGARTCHFDDLSWFSSGRRTVLATVTWRLRNTEGSVVAQWQESYHLLQTDGGLRVLTSSDF